VDDGTNGIGFCYEGNLPGSLAQQAVRELLAPILLGQDLYLTERIWSQMYDASLLQGRAGSVMRGLSAVDIALWDRNAKAAGLPYGSTLERPGKARFWRTPAVATTGLTVDVRCR
jgi:L-alanine-DL-glutamate epimerase-like enolase superfamily enzyme